MQIHRLFGLRLFTDNSIKARLIRTFLPTILLVSTVIGLAFVKLYTAYPGLNPFILIATSIFVIIIALVIAISVIARRIGNDLDRVKNELITSRQAMEKSLERLNLAAEAGNFGIWDWDVRKNDLVWDDKMYKLYGIGKDQFKGEYEVWLAGLHPEDRGAAQKAVDNALSGKKEYDFEFRILWPNQEVRVIKANGKVIRDANGAPVRMIGVNFDITERREAEVKLVQSELRFRGLFENIPVGVAVYEVKDGGKDFIFKDYNPAGEKLDNDSRERLIGKSIFEMRPGIEKFGLIETFRRVWQTGQPTRHPVTRYTDKVISGWYDNLVYKLPSGEIVAVFENITDLKRAEMALRESEQRFKSIVENLNDAFYIHDFDGNILDCNENACRILGYCRNELIGATLDTIIPPGHTGLFHDRMQKLVDEGKIFFENQERRKDGKLIPVLVSARVVSREGNGIVQSTVHEFSEQKMMQDALRASEERFRELTTFAPVGIYLTDEKGDYAYANEAWLAMAGLTMEQATGKGWVRALHPDDRETISVAWYKSVQSDETWRFEYRFQTPQGKINWVAGTAKKILDSKGNRAGYIGANLDITERKNSESDRQKLEQQLQQTQKLESLGVLAGGIAHDFNNLLASLFGYLELARRYVAADQERSADFLDKSLSVFERAKGLTQQLLTFSKGGAPMKKKCAIAPIVRDSISFAVHGTTVACSFKIDADLWYCDFDANQISQVFSNVAINAQQAMPMGGSITVTAVNVILAHGDVAELPAGRYVRFSIRDTGIGIPEEILPRIFDPFFTTKQKGSGLGLAISYSIVKRHDGHLEAVSEPGKGTAFIVYLPAIASTQADAAQETIEIKAGSGRILIMDDEECVRDVALEMLAGMGYEALTVQDGKEAIAACKKAMAEGTPFKAAILDLTIPGGMGGKEAVGELIKTTPGLLVIASSGYAEDPVMADPGAYGFSDKLAKPYRVVDMAEILGKHTSG